PPLSALFPYTTLFRSLHRAAEIGKQICVRAGGGAFGAVKVVPPHRCEEDLPLMTQVGSAIDHLGDHAELLGKSGQVVAVGVEGVDRKSTRLNSSHVAI